MSVACCLGGTAAWGSHAGRVVGVLEIRRASSETCLGVLRWVLLVVQRCLHWAGCFPSCWRLPSVASARQPSMGAGRIWHPLVRRRPLRMASNGSSPRLVCHGERNRKSSQLLLLTGNPLRSIPSGDRHRSARLTLVLSGRQRFRPRLPCLRQHLVPQWFRRSRRRLRQKRRGWGWRSSPG